MNGFTMIVAIVFMVIVGAIVILQQIRGFVGKNKAASQNERQLAEQITQLEQRVQILERIATDGKSELKDKIDAL